MAYNPPATRSPNTSLPAPVQVWWLQNKQATLNEYNVGIALTKHGREYLFQVSYWGGRSIRGGQVLDFLIFTPFEEPLQVFGNYWHEGQLSSEDKYKIALLEQFLNRDLLIVWGRESETLDDTVKALRKLRVI